MIIRCDIYFNTFIKNNMYEATASKNALKNTYSCKTSVIDYKYQYSSWPSSSLFSLWQKKRAKNILENQTT